MGVHCTPMIMPGSAHACRARPCGCLTLHVVLSKTRKANVRACTLGVNFMANSCWICYIRACGLLRTRSTVWPVSCVSWLWSHSAPFTFDLRMLMKLWLVECDINVLVVPSVCYSSCWWCTHETEQRPNPMTVKQVIPSVFSLMQQCLCLCGGHITHT
jgi:hypothetical protein